MSVLHNHRAIAQIRKSYELPLQIKLRGTTV